MLPYSGGLQLVAIALSIATVTVDLAEPVLRCLRRLLTTNRPRTIPNEVATDRAVDSEQRNEEILLTGRDSTKGRPVGDRLASRAGG